MTKPKYLTKSRFKLALECPTRVRFSLESSRYKNQKSENPFLLALAEGGFQVGEWAKLHHPTGRDCITLNNEEALSETAEWLQQGERVIFEAALKSGFKFVRVDVLEVTDEEIRIIEVKSKSVNGQSDAQFFGKRGAIQSAWRPYLEDLAFQVHVAQEHFDHLGWNLPVRGYLFCPDKHKTASVDGLHEHFVIRRDESGRAFCQVKSGVDMSDLGDSMMTLVDGNRGIQAILSDKRTYRREGWECTSFPGAIAWLEDMLKMHSRGLKIPFMPVGAHCATCSFSTKLELPEDGKVSGRRACFEHSLDWSQGEFDRPKVWDVWNLRSKKSIIEGGRWFMDELTEEDFKIDLEEPEVLTNQERLPQAQRQWIQICAAKGTYTSTYLDVEGLRRGVSQFTWPLHFIDFETTAPAIPFYKGYAPYHGVSFQFSHHILHEDGRLEHAGQHLGPGQGTDPTFEFVQELHRSLSKDKGAVFMYSHHENTYLNYAHELLRVHSPFPLAETKELLEFLQSLTKPTDRNEGRWTAGPRLMVDMAEMVRNHFWHPRMAGSNSIKAVLPAVLNSSAEMQAKYSEPIYGTEAMPSLNYNCGFSWIQRADDGTVKDPYSLLPELKEESLGEDLEVIERLFGDDSIGNGGAAMTAWSYMQFAEMSATEKVNLEEALKKYCELDTLAMAMIMEYFLLEISKS